MGGFVAVCGVRVVKASGGARLFVAAVLGAFVFWGTPASVSGQERSGEMSTIEEPARNNDARERHSLTDSGRFARWECGGPVSDGGEVQARGASLSL